MQASDFAYWLQGFAELNGKPPTKEQWEMIKEHLQLVFNKVTTKTVPTYCSPKITIDTMEALGAKSEPVEGTLRC